MDGITVTQVVTAIGVFGVISAYLHSKSVAAKEQTDQFHARINRGVEDQHEAELKIAKLEGINEGIQIGRNQVIQELSLNRFHEKN